MTPHNWYPVLVLAVDSAPRGASFYLTLPTKPEASV